MAAERLLRPLAVGTLAGLCVAHIHLHLGLSGHKALFWITPVLACRALNRGPLGTTLGFMAAGCTASALGGHVAGGLLGLPMLGIAGIGTDLLLLALKTRLDRDWVWVPTLAALGTTSNALAWGKRLLIPPGPHAMAGEGLLARAEALPSYLFFGLVAGVIAGVVVVGVRRADGRRRQKNNRARP